MIIITEEILSRAFYQILWNRSVPCTKFTTISIHNFNAYTSLATYLTVQSYYLSLLFENKITLIVPYKDLLFGFPQFTFLTLSTGYEWPSQTCELAAGYIWLFSWPNSHRLWSLSKYVVVKGICSYPEETVILSKVLGLNIYKYGILSHQWPRLTLSTRLNNRHKLSPKRPKKRAQKQCLILPWEFVDTSHQHWLVKVHVLT